MVQGYSVEVRLSGMLILKKPIHRRDQQRAFGNCVRIVKSPKVENDGLVDNRES